MATRLMWIPGMRPVIVPAMMPRRRGRIRWSMIMYHNNLYKACFMVLFMSEELRVKIPIGTRFNSRGEDPNEEVLLVNEVLKNLCIASEVRLGITKRSVVLPEGDLYGVRFETTYKGVIILPKDEGRERVRLFNVSAVTYDSPPEFGHNVYLYEDFKIELPELNGSVQLKDALFFPSGAFAHVCSIKVPDKESFLETLLERGYTEDTLSGVGGAVNTDQSLEICIAAGVVAKYMEHLSYSVSN